MYKSLVPCVSCIRDEFLEHLSNGLFIHTISYLIECLANYLLLWLS